jgi:hypothetical protein
MPQYAANTVVGLAYAAISTLTTTTVKPVAGLLSSIVVNSATTGATVAIYDGNASTGTLIAQFVLGTVTVPTAVQYGLTFQTSLTVVTSVAAVSLTVVYR